MKAGVAELPVFTVGWIKDPALAEEIFAAGKADMVAMTRAQIADPARRGHSVTLLEREAALGGQINLILRTPGRDEFGWITRDLQVQLRKAEVQVQLGSEATADLVGDLAPDGVIVATGAVPSRTGFSSVNPLVEQLPGSDQDNVLTGWDVLLRSRPVGDRVVVLDDDGSRQAAGVVEVLLDAGKQVELVSRWPSLFPGRRRRSTCRTSTADCWARASTTG